jgi:hypothetical protein
VTGTLSEGALQLAASGSISITAKRLGVAARTVSTWRGGGIPSASMRARIELILGVKSAAWHRAPAGAVVAPPTPVDADTALVIESLRAQHARLLAAISSGELTPRAALEYERLALRVSREIARLERRQPTKPHARAMALAAAKAFRERADALDVERAARAAGDPAPTTPRAADVATPSH